MKKLIKKYQLWTYSDGGYNLNEFDTIEECIEDVTEHFTNDWYITKRVDIDFKETKKQGG